VSERARAQILVLGYVQGVGYRFFVEDEATALGLDGYVRNTYDGGVEVVAEGPKSKIEQLISLLKVGPATAEVEEVKVTWQEYRGDAKGFRIRY